MLFKICLVLQSGISSFWQTNTADLPSWLALIVVNLTFSNMSQIFSFDKKKGGADVVEGFLLEVVTWWAPSVFLMISSFEKSCMFYEISFASTIFVSFHVFWDHCFLMFLKTSVFLRLLFLRSSNSVSNWWILIAWLVAISFSSANLNFKPYISSLFSRTYILAPWAVVLTAFGLRWISFVTLLSFSSNDVSLIQAHWIWC